MSQLIHKQTITMTHHQNLKQCNTSKRSQVYERIEARRKNNIASFQPSAKSNFRKKRTQTKERQRTSRDEEPAMGQKFQIKIIEKEKGASEKIIKTQYSQESQTAENSQREKIESEGVKLNDRLNEIELKISSVKKKLFKKREELPLGKKFSVQEESPIKIEFRKNNSSKQKLRKQNSEPQEMNGHRFKAQKICFGNYYVSRIIGNYKDKKSIVRKHLQTTLGILSFFDRAEKPSDDYFENRRLDLPKREGYEDKKTIVFDLDETLIHCNESLEDPYDIQLPVAFPTGEIINAGVCIRPYTEEILKNLSEYFEIIVFTASHSSYANVILDYLDPQREFIHHRLFREHCYQSQGMHIKDLRVLDREMSQVVIIDNAAYSYIHQLDNGIPIIPYYDGNNDFELMVLEEYLRSLLDVPDMREVNRKSFKLREYKNYIGNIEGLVEGLYIHEG